ncbi:MULTISPECIES: hypothetical protein [Microbacterium]|uniref:hypothetical protein n=1 Tax=Microbacterium TaxID=33882 RepID=UPI00344D696E
MKFFRAKVLIWPFVVLLAAALALSILGAVQGWRLPSFLGGSAYDRDSQVVQSVETKEEVALVSLGIQGIKRRETTGNAFWGKIPGATRVSLLQYEFQAKLGLDGSRVKVVPDGDGRFTVTIPDFIFIGYDKPHFEAAIDQNGALSWFAPEIEETDLINAVLGEASQQDYLVKYKEDLREQAKVFYTGIINAIDPDVALDFQFAD